MSAATVSPPPAPAAGEPPIWPITVAMFAQMVRAGIIDSKDRVYLYKGRLAPRMTVYRPHTYVVQGTHYALLALNIEGVIVDQEQPMALRLEHSVPMPDVKLVRGQWQDRIYEWPTSADVPLVVEVSDSTLPKDRAMAATYAREGIPVYWIVNIPDRRIEVYDGPGPEGYARMTPYAEGRDVPVVVDGREVGRIAVAELLPPPLPREG